MDHAIRQLQQLQQYLNNVPDNTKPAVYMVGTCVVGLVVMWIIRAASVIASFFTLMAPSEIDTLAAKQLQQQRHRRNNKHSKQQKKPTPTAPTIPQQQPQQQQPPQPAGISLKSLMKQKKSSTNAAHAHAAADDHATQHPCYLTTFKGHEDTVVDLAFDHTGGTLATVCEDRIVRLYRCGELASRGPGASATFRRVPLPIAGGLAGVAFGRDASELVVMTAGAVEATSLAMYDLTSTGGLDSPVWKVPNVLKHQPGMVLHASCSGTRPTPLFLCCSPESVMTVVTGIGGRLLASINTNGLKNHDAAMSRDGRFVAAATFTADVKVHEVKMDKSGAFTGAPKVFDLKGHTSQVTAIDFSPDTTRAVTCSKDGTWRVWKIDVRYTLNEDPKCLHTVPLTNKKAPFTKLAYGPGNVVAALQGVDIVFLDAAAGKVLETITAPHGAGAAVTCMQWAGEAMTVAGKQYAVLATGGADRRVRMWRGPG